MVFARIALLVGLSFSAGLSPGAAQEQPDGIKSWVAADWAAKDRFLAERGASPRRECETEDGAEACLTVTVAEVGGWTLTMMAGEGERTEATFCIERTGGRLRWCKDDRTGETRKFFRNGDDWDVFGR